MIAEALMCLALNAYHEARDQDIRGMVAVSQVVMNRVESDLFPDDVCEVVMQGPTRESWKTRQYIDIDEEDREYYPIRHRCQFSWYCDGRSDDPLPGRAWEKSKYIARMFLTHDEYRGITEGATHYHATYVSPRWATAKGMHMVGQIGEHIFYRWK